jgi:hypothetical protein
VTFSERNIRSAISGLLLVLAAYVARDRLPLLGVLFCGAFVLLMIDFTYRERISMAIYYFGFVVFAFGLGEFYLWDSGGRAEAHFEGAYKANYFIADDELGYGLTPWKRRVSSIKRSDKDGGLIYNVTYQINALGFRDAVHNGEASPVFFFGDSFTFGEGVDDDDTLPAQFSKIAGRTVFNFGVHGYGPHQFLRMLEVDRPEKLGVTDKPALVIYTLLADHVDRAAGRASWDREGPLYELSPAGLVYRGSFRSHRPIAERVLDRSYVYRLIGPMLSETRDRRRVLAIIERANQLVKERYGTDLLVVVWDAGMTPRSQIEKARMAWLADGLSKAGIAHFSVSEIAPPLQGPPYYIAGDGHPNRTAYAAVAKAIVAHCSKIGCFEGR